MSLIERLNAARRVSVPIVCINTPDPEATVRKVADEVNHGTAMIKWDFNCGLQSLNVEGSDAMKILYAPPRPDHPEDGQVEPDDVVANAAGLLHAIRKLPKNVFVFVHLAHHHLDNVAFIQGLCNLRDEFKRDCRMVVLLVKMGFKLDDDVASNVMVIPEEYPDLDALASIVATAYKDDEMELDDVTRERAANLLKGLPAFQAEQIVYTSLVRHEGLDFDEMWSQKKTAVERGPGLSLHRGTETFSDLGGLSPLKSFCARSMQKQGNPNPLLRPRGVMLLGVPGTGKSAFCKALGNETGRPTLILDVGALMGSLVGESEANTRAALQVVDAMAPCVLMIDEVEKALSGIGGQGDSGVSARLFGAFLTWLNDHTSDVFVVVTCNDISKLPPEFSRAERFDGIFFLDMPDDKQRASIWAICRELFGISDTLLPEDLGWTGAEIRACCRLAALHDISLADAAKYIVPVYATSRESVDKLKAWARNRCLDANASGIYENKITMDSAIRSVSDVGHGRGIS